MGLPGVRGQVFRDVHVVFDGGPQGGEQTGVDLLIGQTSDAGRHERSPGGLGQGRCPCVARGAVAGILAPTGWWPARAGVATRCFTAIATGVGYRLRPASAAVVAAWVVARPTGSLPRAVVSTVLGTRTAGTCRRQNHHAYRRDSPSAKGVYGLSKPVVSKHHRKTWGLRPRGFACLVPEVGRPAKAQRTGCLTTLKSPRS